MAMVSYCIGQGIRCPKPGNQGIFDLQKGLEKDEEDLVGGEYFWIAWAYATIGDYEKAEVYSRKAAKFVCFGVGQVPYIYMTQGKFQEALQFADSQVVDCPQECSRSLFRASLLLGEFEQAEHYFNQWRNAGQDYIVFELIINYEIGYVLYQLGRAGEAEKIFTEQIERLELELDNYGRNAYLGLARIYAFKGEKKEALAYLTKYAKKGFVRGWHDFILIDPFFESLRDDPEFKAIVETAQDEKAALRKQVREMEARGELTL